jgi:hypothetical protein
VEGKTATTSIEKAAEMHDELSRAFPGLCKVCGEPAFQSVPCWEGEPSPAEGGAMHMRDYTDPTNRWVAEDKDFESSRYYGEGRNE